MVCASSKKMPGVKLVFLTMNEDPDLAVEAMRSGASAYLLKSSAAEELLRAYPNGAQRKAVCYAADREKECRSLLSRIPK